MRFSEKKDKSTVYSGDLARRPSAVSAVPTALRAEGTGETYALAFTMGRRRPEVSSGEHYKSKHRVGHSNRYRHMLSRHTAVAVSSVILKLLAPCKNAGPCNCCRCKTCSFALICCAAGLTCFVHIIVHNTVTKPLFNFVTFNGSCTLQLHTQSR